MKVRKIIPVPYAQVETDTNTYHVYADGRVLYFNCEGALEHYADWEDNYAEIKAAGLEALK